MQKDVARATGRIRALLPVCITCFAAGFGAAAIVKRLPENDPGGGAVAPSKPGGTRADRVSKKRLQSAERHFQQGYRLLQSERYSEALEAFKKAAGIDPTDPRPHHGMGEVYQKMVFVERAEAAYRKALEIDPDFDHSKKQLAALVYERGGYEEATRLLEELRAKNPDDTFIWAELALNALALGKAEEAVSLLKRYNAARGPQAWGYTNLGKAQQAAGDPAHAEESFRRALAIDPRFTGAHYALGQLLATRGEQAESARWLKSYQQLRNLETRAHEMRMELLRDADDVDALMSLAQIRVRLGKVAEALPLIERARGIQPGNASIQAIYEKVKQAVAKSRESE